MQVHTRLFKVFLFLSFGFAGLFLLLTTGCSKEKSKRELPVVKAIKAETLTIQQSEVPNIRIFPGRVRSKVSVVLAAKMAGYVKKVPVQIGDQVQKGELLILVDDTDVKANIKALESAKAAATSELNAIEAKYEYAKINYNRFKRLYSLDSATKDELDRAQTQYLALKNQTEAIKAKINRIKAQLKEARNQLSYLQIKAPMDGWISQRMVDPGTYINPGIPLIKLDGQGVGFWFQASIDDSLINNIRPGERVTVSIPALDLTVKAPVVHIQPSSQPSTHTFTLLADMDSMSLRSGLFGRIFLETGTNTCIILPDKVIVDRGGIKGVYVVDDNNILHWRIVRLGKRWIKTKQGLLPVLQDLPTRISQGKIYVTVLSGLSPRERIVASNLSQAVQGGRLE